MLNSRLSDLKISSLYKIIALFLIVVLLIFFLVSDKEGVTTPLQFNQDDRFLYEISSVSTTKSVKNSSTQLSGSASFNLKMNVRVFSVDNEHITLGVEFDKLDYKVNSEKVDEAFINMYETPFLMTLNRNGTVEETLYSNTIAEGDEAFIQNIIYYSDVNIIYDKVKWKARHTNLFGEYIAYYKVLNKKEFEKQIGRYLSYNDAIEIDVKESRGLYKISDTKSWFDSIDITQKEIIKLTSNTNQLLAHQRMKILRSNETVDNTLKLYSFDSLNEFKAFLTKGKKEKQMLQKRQANKQMQNSLNNSKISADAIIKDYLDKKLNLHDLQEYLIQYLTLYPDEAFKFLDLIQNGQIDDEMAMILIGVMVEVGNDESQSVLNTILWDDSIHEVVRQNVSMMIGFLKNPNDNTITQLWSYYDNHDTTNTLISSSVSLAIGNLGERNQDLYDKVAPRLKDELSKAKDSNAIGVLLGSLGNTKNPDILDSVKSFTSNSESLIRKESIKAIGKVKGADDKVVEYIYNQMKTEKSSEVLAQMGESLEGKQLSKKVVESAAISLQYFNAHEDSVDPTAMIRIVAKDAHNSQLARHELKYMMAQNYNPRIKGEIIKGLSQ